MNLLRVLFANIDIIDFANYFLAGFVGSAARTLKCASEGECTNKRSIIYMIIYNGVMGGFAGMLITRYSDLAPFNYAVAGITGGVGIEKVINYISKLLDLKITIGK